MTKNSCQKKTNFSEISGAKVVQFRCYIKSTETKNVPLNWYSSTKLFFRKIQMIFDVEIDFENQILVLFDSYFWTFYKSHEKIKFIFVISAIIPSIWNVFIKFCWHDEKFTLGCSQFYGKFYFFCWSGLTRKTELMRWQLAWRN